MSVFILQMIIISLAGRRVRERSHVPQSVKRTSLETTIGLLANSVWFLALAYSVFLPLRFGTAWFAAGSSVFILGVLILSVATCNFMTTPADQVIRTGAYAFSRHPMYLATFLICLGSGIAAASGIFILLSLIMIVCFHFEAVLEEKYCLRIYGAQYRTYGTRVPRWVGLPKRRRGLS